MPAYRDDLEAAHGRIEQLEAELAEAKKQKREPEKRRREKKQRKKKTPRARSGLWVFLKWGAISIGGALGMFLLVTALGGHSEGVVASQGGELGDWSLPITRCRSGQDLSPAFDGVHLYGEDADASLRIARQGGRIWITVWSPRSPDQPPGSRAGGISIDPSACSQREVEMERSSWSGTAREGEGTVWNMNGHARLECATPGEGTLSADVTFDRCTF